MPPMVEDQAGPRPTVLVVGLGDLGARVLDALARSAVVGRLVGTSRDPRAAHRHAAQAALVAELSGGPQQVDGVGLDLLDGDEAIRLLLEVCPDVTVMTASLHTWWRPPDGIAPGAAVRLDQLPYGVWLPRQVPLVRRLMEAHRAAGSPGRVVSLAFPDAVGPVLAPAGLAPDLGAGNVDEVAAKLRARGAGGGGRPGTCPRPARSPSRGRAPRPRRLLPEHRGGCRDAVDGRRARRRRAAARGDGHGALP